MDGEVMSTARFLTYTAAPLALLALFAALQNPALFLWYAALLWFAFGCGGIAAGVLMRDQRDRAREELARRRREDEASGGWTCRACWERDLSARMVDVARAADRLRPDLRIVAPERDGEWPRIARVLGIEEGEG
jgi:hypothetical protein